jgi:hypothetical protein
MNGKRPCKSKRPQKKLKFWTTLIPIIRKPYIICAVILANPCFIHVHDIIPCFPKRFDLSQIITYQQEMNSVVFLEWFENQLMPALKNPSLVVLDNAMYHNVKTEESVCPNFSQLYRVKFTVSNGGSWYFMSVN